MISKPGTFDSILYSDDRELSAAEKKLGFPIPKGKTVVHVNGNKEDFEKNNIFLADQSSILNLRRNIQDIFQELIREKIVTFDSFRGAYSKQRTPVRRIIVNNVVKQEIQNSELSEIKKNILTKNKEPTLVPSRRVESNTVIIYVEIDV